MSKPISVGKYLKVNALRKYGVSICTLSKMLQVSRKAVSKLVNGNSRLSISMARRLSVCLGVEVSFLIGIQSKLDIWIVENMNPPKNVKRLSRI